MVAAVTTIRQTDARPGGTGKASEQSWSDNGACTFQGGGGTPGVGLRLIADRLQTGNAVLESWIVQIGYARFNGVIEPLESQFGLDRAFVQLRDMLAASLHALLAAVQKRGQDFFKALRIKQTILQMVGDKIVQLGHWYG